MGDMVMFSDLAFFLLIFQKPATLNIWIFGCLEMLLLEKGTV